MTDDKHEWMDAANARDAAVRYLVENTDLSPNQAKEVVAQHGTDRAKLIEVARTMKAES